MGSHPYYRVLARVHEDLRPRTYLEIGVRDGASAALALSGTKVIGVDPAPRLAAQLPPGSIIEPTTSDEFFLSGRAQEVLEGRPVDLAFIDGMHLFEFALRDFVNVERHALPSSVVLVHDCLPRSAAETDRTGLGANGAWAGDVWKLLAWMADERPDLKVTIVDAAPTGLGVITKLDPTAPALDVHAVADRYRSLSFDDFPEAVLRRVDVVRGTWTDIRAALPDSPWQPTQHRRALVRERERRLQPGASRLRRIRRQLGRSGAGRRVLTARERIVRR